jgi:hypothetical protein
MATSFSGGRSRSTRREPPTMGKQLVNFITCGCKLSAPSAIWVVASTLNNISILLTVCKFYLGFLHTMISIYSTTICSSRKTNTIMQNNNMRILYTPWSCVNTWNHLGMMLIICPTICMCELKNIWSFITVLLYSQLTLEILSSFNEVFYKERWWQWYTLVTYLMCNLIL